MLTWLYVTAGLGLAGVVLWQVTRSPEYQPSLFYVVGMLLMTFCGVGAFSGFIEFGVMRVVGQTRLGAIAQDHVLRGAVCSRSRC